MAKRSKSMIELPVPVFRIMTDQLDSKDIATLRLVSRAARYMTEPIFFHVLRMHDTTRMAEDINENISDRLQYPNSNLCQYVQHLKIGPFKQEKNVPSAQVLNQSLLSIKSLQEFSWDARFKIPQDVLDTFHAKWPRARLHVNNTDRVDRFIPLDSTLISSPQLHSLHLAVFVHSTRGFHTSEFPALYYALLSAKSLKSLRLEILEHNEQRSTFNTGPANLPFNEGDVFPSLLELALPYQKYTLTRSHCQAWLRAMDWSTLQNLDLDGGAPRYFLAALTGHVQYLKILKLGLKPAYQFAHELWTCPDLEIVRTFLRSISGLEELYIQAHERSDFDEIKAVVYSSHGKSLRTLKLQHLVPYTRPWSVEDVEYLSERCPDLRCLGLPLAIAGDADVDHPISPDSVVAKLGRFLHLEEIDLELKLGSENSSFTFEDDHQTFIQELAVERYAAALLALLRGQNKNLDILKVNFVTLFQEYTLTLRKEQEPEKNSYMTRPGMFGLNPHGGYFDPWG